MCTCTAPVGILPGRGGPVFVPGRQAVGICVKRGFGDGGERQFRPDTGSTELLDAFSDTCLRRFRRAEHSSYSMTTMLHTDPARSAFGTRLQLYRLNRVATSPHAVAELAENHTGLPLAG